jgi:hypothetical protein
MLKEEDGLGISKAESAGSSPLGMPWVKGRAVLEAIFLFSALQYGND